MSEKIISEETYIVFCRLSTGLKASLTKLLNKMVKNSFLKHEKKVGKNFRVCCEFFKNVISSGSLEIRKKGTIRDNIFLLNEGLLFRLHRL